MSAEREGKHWFIWFMIIFQLTVVLGFFIGLYLLYQDFSFSRRAVLTQGEIVDIDYSDRISGVRAANGGLNIYPTFAFTDPEGNRQTVKPIVAMDGRFSLGDRRDILIDPANPSTRVVLAGWRFYMGIGGIVIMVTAPMAALFIWAQIRLKLRKKRQRLKRNRRARERRARLKAEKLASEKEASAEKT